MSKHLSSFFELKLEPLVAFTVSMGIIPNPCLFTFWLKSSAGPFRRVQKVVVHRHYVDTSTTSSRTRLAYVSYRHHVEGKGLVTWFSCFQVW
jgi:hypothetical protein